MPMAASSNTIMARIAAARGRGGFWLEGGGVCCLGCGASGSFSGWESVGDTVVSGNVAPRTAFIISSADLSGTIGAGDDGFVLGGTGVCSNDSSLSIGEGSGGGGLPAPDCGGGGGGGDSDFWAAWAISTIRNEFKKLLTFYCKSIKKR